MRISFVFFYFFVLFFKLFFFLFVMYFVNKQPDPAQGNTEARTLVLLNFLFPVLFFSYCVTYRIHFNVMSFLFST
jgi:hypothetical protein